MDTKILGKIRALLALGQSSNPHEAAAAMGRAQELMDRHRISEAVLAAEAPAGGSVEPEQELGKQCVDAARNKPADWKVRLLGALAHANDCRAIRTRMHQGYELRIYGGVRDVQTTMYVYQCITREVDRLARVALQALPLAQKGEHTSRRWGADFRLGCVDTIGKRLKESREETRQKVQAEAYAKGGENALVVVNKGLARIEAHKGRVARYYQAQVGKTSSLGASRVTSAGAFEAGQRAGAGVDLSRNRRAGLSAGSAGSLKR